MRRRKNPAKGNYAFIDSQNLNLGTQRVGWKMNWRRFREWLDENYQVEKAFMFIGYMPENENLYELMHGHGFLVVLKPTLEMYKVPVEGTPDKPAEKDEDKPPVKGNVDAELVLYAMKELPNYGKAIIVSGDGDFFSLAEHLNEQGKLMHIMTPNRQYSTLLKVFEDKIIRLDEHKRELQYLDHRPRQKRQ